MPAYGVQPGYGSSPNASTGGGSAAYPGLGGPIGAYGQSAGGMGMGPYSFLQGGSSGGGTAGSLSGGNQQAQQFLSGVLSGNTLPYGQTQQTAMLGQASAMNAASEAAQNHMAQANATAGGASPTDPSMQGVMAQNMAQRQNNNQNAAGQIAANANSANYQAQAGAAGGLLSNGIQQQELGLQAQGMANQQRNTAMGYLSGMMGGGRSGGGSQGQQGLSNQNNGFASFGGDPSAQPVSSYNAPGRSNPMSNNGSWDAAGATVQQDQNYLGY